MKALTPVSATAITPAEEPLEKLLERFLEAQDVAAASKSTYRRQLKPFLTWLQQTDRLRLLTRLTREDILAYKEALFAQGRSAYTVSGYLVVVRKFFEWLEAQKVYPNIAKGVKGAKRSKGFRKDCLTPGQIREALALMDQSTPEGLRDYALFNLLVRTGLRTIEVARATVGDLRQESGEAVLWIQGKGRDSKDDFVLLVEDTLRPLRLMLSARGKVLDTEPLFCSFSDKNTGQAMTTRSISRIIKEALKRAGLDSSRLSAHSLRHTAITLALKGGATLQQAQAMARHTDPKTTLVYVHNLARVEAGAERYIRF